VGILIYFTAYSFAIYSCVIEKYEKQPVYKMMLHRALAVTIYGWFGTYL